MSNICKEFVVMALVAFTYAALTNDPPKVTKNPVAYPFFPRNSIIKDWYRGEISMAIERARENDIAFVMFYAPWDAESQEVRTEFETVARHMHKLVSFAAVNCWQPDSECRQQYSKVYNWPVLIAYPTHGRGVQYNGQKVSSHMIRFLHSMMRPITRISGLDLYYLRQKHEVVVVANVNSLPGSRDYAIFYNTALRYLEKDPFQEVSFAVNTHIPKTDSKKISMYLWNDTILYTEIEWKSDNLYNWIHKNIKQVSKWVSPSGTKSLLLVSYLQPGPTLILFTPRNPMLSSNDYYDLLREVALEYHYCQFTSNSFTTYLLSLGVHKHRLENYKYMKQSCTSSKKKHFINDIILNTVTYAPNSWANDSFNSNLFKNSDTCDGSDVAHLLNKVVDHITQSTKEQLQQKYREILQKYTVDDKSLWEERADYENFNPTFETSNLATIDDIKSSKRLTNTWKGIECELRTLANKYSALVFTETIKRKATINNHIFGHGCNSNRSLTFIAVDSLKYHFYAESLNINIHNCKDKTAIVIIEDKMESYYVLNNIVTDESLRDFLRNFTKNSLNRALSSNEQKSQVHFDLSTCGKENYVCVQELDSDTFIPRISRAHKAVVILYYSKQCSFCSGVSYVFLMTARALSNVTNLEFARINGDLNALPWEYTMGSFPTILFIPTTRKSESRVFSQNIAITVPNLISFVLTNLNPIMRLESMYYLCNRTKLKSERELCVSSLRIETLSLIGKTLKEWRQSNPLKRQEILNRLQQLRNLHLLLAHSPDNIDLIQKSLTNIQMKNFLSVEDTYSYRDAARKYPKDEL